MGLSRSSGNASQIHVGNYFQSRRRVQKAIVVLTRVIDCPGVQCVGENYVSFVGLVGVGASTGYQNMIFSRNKNKQKFRGTTSTS